MTRRNKIVHYWKNSNASRLNGVISFDGAHLKDLVRHFDHGPITSWRDTSLYSLNWIIGRSNLSNLMTFPQKVLIFWSTRIENNNWAKNTVQSTVRVKMMIWYRILKPYPSLYLSSFVTEMRQSAMQHKLDCWSTKNHTIQKHWTMYLELPSNKHLALEYPTTLITLTLLRMERRYQFINYVHAWQRVL